MKKNAVKPSVKAGTRLPRRKADALIIQYTKLARSIASSAYRRLPNHDFGDILGAAMLGLTDAARRFDPSKGVPFECYARTRISGSIIDAHRSLHKVGYVNEFPPDPVVEADVYTADLEAFQLRKAITPHLKILSDFEQQLVSLRYVHSLTLREIAAHLDVSECHISQVHRAILNKLRPRLAGIN